MLSWVGFGTINVASVPLFRNVHVSIAKRHCSGVLSYGQHPSHKDLGRLVGYNEIVIFVARVFLFHYNPVFFCLVLVAKTIA